ncbi:unnamed protein product [Rotaria sordida]|uniref:Uncharacterized protein n=1 Tax=Rotaria sordida TaxID=392033 RepID=A0A818UQA9_9BILA|nr:unnamed protein product [Rotaria sordida]CAF3701618.1 unnamed protein product [Rotaria sordida]
MESNQVQTYHISRVEQPDDKEQIVLRALIGNPNRHKPLVQHPPPTTNKSQDATPAPMYTLETRNRPIPSRVLPKSKEPTVYYIEPKRVEQSLTYSVPLSKEERDTTQPSEPEVLKSVEQEQESPPIDFLEPKIISQPVLYSVVAEKTPLVQNDQPITTNQDVDLPILYAITGQSHLPTIDMGATTSNVKTPVVDKSPNFYSLVGNPHIPIIDMGATTSNVEIPVVDKSPNFYSLVGNPHIPVQPEEPISKTSSSQSPPNLYSIVGSPILSPNTLQTNAVDSTLLTQPAEISSVQSEPVLYTIVDEKQMPTNIPKEDHPPPAEPVKKQTNDSTLYTVIGDPQIPQSMTPIHKTQPIKPQASSQQIQIPTLYATIGKPNLPSTEKMTIQPKPSVSKKTPSSTDVRTRRTNQSLERKTAPEAVIEEITPISDTKNKRHTKSQELRIPKSETIFVPIPEYERASRPKQLRTTPRNISPRQTHCKTYAVPRYEPFRPSDYISPYTYHPSKPYREQTYRPKLLPIVTNNSSERKTRPLLYEPRHRVERKHPYDPWTPHSLERYPYSTKQPSRLWDFEEHALTDGDDDMNDSTSSGRKGTYRRIRPRSPWIPVW